MTATLSDLLKRILAALPDCVSGGVFLALWIAPLQFGASGVGNGMLVMLVEFLLIHATIMLPVMIVLVMSRFGESIKLGWAIAASAAVYVLAIGALSYAFKEWWPLVVFVWLLFGKIGLNVFSRESRTAQGENIGAVWLVSVLAYLGGIFVTALLPMPRLGFADIQRSALDLPSGATGIWLDDPHRVMAFGVIYFFVLAFAKWKLCDPAGPQLAAGTARGRRG